MDRDKKVIHNVPAYHRIKAMPRVFSDLGVEKGFCIELPVRIFIASIEFRMCLDLLEVGNGVVHCLIRPSILPGIGILMAYCQCNNISSAIKIEGRRELVGPPYTVVDLLFRRLICFIFIGKKDFNREAIGRMQFTGGGEIGCVEQMLMPVLGIAVSKGKFEHSSLTDPPRARSRASLQVAKLIVIEGAAPVKGTGGVPCQPERSAEIPSPSL